MLTNYINIQHHCTLNVVTHMLLFSCLDNMWTGMYMQMVVGFSEVSVDDPHLTMVCLTST